MNVFLWNLLLAGTWAMATGEFSLGNLIVGFILGYICLLFARRRDDPEHYFARVPLVFVFAVTYLWDLFLANMRVAYDVITPRHYMKPGVIAVPLEVRTDAEIILLSNLITLTPGTLSLDLSQDRRILYVHFMYIDGGDIDRARDEIKNRLERRVLQVLR